MLKKISITIFTIFTISSIWAGTKYLVLPFTVKDYSTGLTWMHCPVNDNLSAYEDISCNSQLGTMTITEAINFCNNLVYRDKNNWRLPSIKELHSIVTYYDKAELRINETAFPIKDYQEYTFWGIVTIQFWSSTATQSGGITSYYIVDFAYGSISFGGNDDETKKFVRCVSSE